MRFPVVPKTYQQLKNQARPAQPGQPEAIPYWLYDTQTYTSATSVALTFFGAAVADRSLSNMALGGQLQVGEYFEIHRIGLDAWVDGAGWVSTAVGGAAGHLDDLGRLMLIGRPRFVINMNSKAYGPWPATLLHATGGPIGGGYGTFTAEESLQYANNGVFDGGAPVDGAIVIPPSTGFNVVMDWSAAQTLTDDWRLRVVLGGVLYRPVQ